MGDGDKLAITAADIFGPGSAPMPAAVKAARQAIRGEIPDDDLRDTDAAIAAAFALDHFDALRFDYRRRAWLHYAGGLWREDRSAGAHRLLQSWCETRVFEQVAAATSKRDMDAMRAAARRTLGARPLRALLELAAMQAPIADAGDAWDPDPWLLATLDGHAIDLRSGVARRATSDDRLTLACGVPYSQDATCETFQNFVAQVCDDDPALMRLVQVLAGYTVSGITTEQVFIVLTGAGSNGKSTLLELLAYVMGDYAAVLPFATLAKDRDIRSVPVEIARLPGRRFVRASEIRGGVALDEGRLKSITGEDTLSARGLYQSPFEFRSVAKLWLAVNKLPRVDDRGHAFWRRAIVLPFRRTFDGSTRDNRLKDKLQAEGAGILNWLIEGALMWQRDGLPRGVEAADRARDDWRESQDLIGQWAHDHVVSDTAAATKAAQAFAAFKTWATTEGLSDREIPGSRTFGEWMGENFKRARRRGGIVYECRVVVQGAGLEAVSGNPHTRAQEGDSPKALHTIHTMHQKSEEDEPDGRF